MYGKKIDNLIELGGYGFNVPKFQVIKFDEAFDVPEFKKLLKENQNLPAKTFSKKISEYIENNFKYDFKLDKLSGNKFAIRSASNIEDGLTDSFAGQFDTFLNVSQNNINAKIKDCFKSLANQNVIEYMRTKNISFADLKMNVIVQEMIEAEYSGIIFTANPQGIINESVIVVGRGVGEGVVTDKVDTTSYYYNLDDELYYYDGKENLLNQTQVKKLIEISQKISQKLGYFADIEYAIRKNKIYILQARKITTIKENYNPVILDNSNIVESYPGISSPFTVSFAKSVYTNIIKKECERILKNKKDLEKLDEVLGRMVTSANGRLYYEISNWYNLMVLLPFSKKLIKNWQEMLGVKNTAIYTTKIKYGFFKKAKIAFNYAKEIKNSQKNMAKLNDEFKKINQYFKQNFNDKSSVEDIIKIYRKIEHDVLSIWDITLVNDMYAFIFTGLLKKRLSKNHKNYEQLTNEYISGISNIESVKPIKSLITLTLDKQNLSGAEFAKRKAEYIEEFGDRGLEELKIETKTYRSNPELLDAKIKEYSSNLDRLNQLKNDLSKKKNVRFDNSFFTKYLLKNVHSGITNRETSRLNRSRIYGMVRSMVLRIGEIYQEHGIIETKRDIFYLDLNEVFNKNYRKQNYKEIIKERKTQYKNYEKIPAYSRLVFVEKVFDKYHLNINDTKLSIDKETFNGVPCSNGVVKAEALVVNDIQKINNVSGKILITKTTDPGWVFLLATASGVISEKGSILSHTAIISRELKIPSIVGVKQIMNHIKSGDLIEMNGNTGTIKIIKRIEE